MAHFAYAETRHDLVEMYQKIAATHLHVADTLPSVERAVKQMDRALVMDAIFALKQTQALVEDMRLEIGRRLELFQKLGCLMVAGTAVNRLEGEWATGTAQATEQPSVPHPDKQPEEYRELMLALGASEELIARGVTHPRFTAIERLAAQLGAEGKPLPNALKHAKKIARYTVTARSKRQGGMDAIAHEDRQNVSAELARGNETSKSELDNDNPF